MMNISVSDAKAQLTELVRLAEAGEEIILTRHGKPAIRFTPIKPAYDPQARRAAIDAVMQAAESKTIPGPGAAQSQDFLYDENGLPA